MSSNSDQYLWNKCTVETGFNLSELQICDAPGPLSTGVVRHSSHQLQGLLLKLSSTPIYFEKKNGDFFMHK